MSVIAWDGRTMAADKLSESGRTIQRMVKVYAINGYLVGLAGYAGCGSELLTWFRRGAHEKDFPDSNKSPDAGAQLLVITPQGKPCLIFNTPFPMWVDAPWAVLGCGGESALVAMLCGKTAYQAVEITCAVNSGCGSGVDSIDLHYAREQMEGIALQEGWYANFQKE